MEWASVGERESSALPSAADRRIVAPWWYYATIGAITGSAIVTSAFFLPQQIAGLCLVTAALLVGVTSRIAAWSSGSRLPVPAGPEGVGYLLALAVVVIGSLIVVWSVVRPEGPSWLAGCSLPSPSWSRSAGCG